MHGSAHILLVEDDDDHAELMMRALDDHGRNTTVDRVADGETALAYLLRERDTRPRPDVVLLDLHLPRVDGHEVLRRIKDDPELRSLPVVVLTTSSARRDVVRAHESHVNAYVVKPDDFDELDRMVRDTCSFWLAWNRQRA